jgi:hypothetical protein
MTGDNGTGFPIIKTSAGAFAKPHYRPEKSHPLT